MLVNQQSSLVREAHKALAAGKHILVVGWKDSNHNKFTRGLSPSKVRFFERMPHRPPQHAGLILYTRFTKHKEIWHAQKHAGGTVYTSILGIGMIKSVLYDCRDALRPSLLQQELATEEAVNERKPQQPPRPAPASAIAPHEPDITERLSQSRVQLQVSLLPARPQEPYQLFTTAFLEAVGQNPDNTLGRYTLASLVRTIFGDAVKTAQLVRDKWLEPITVEGRQKIGYYKAGVRMLEFRTQPEPTDPMERVRVLVAKEEEFVRRKNELERELALVNAELNKVAGAKELLGKLADLMK